MQCNFDGILHFKSNSFPKALYYLGITRTRNFCKFCKTFIPVPGTSVRPVGYSYTYPELMKVLYASDTNTRGRGTAILYLPGTYVSSVCQCHKYPGDGYSFFTPARNFCTLCTPVSQYPELMEVL